MLPSSSPVLPFLKFFSTAFFQLKNVSRHLNVSPLAVMMLTPKSPLTFVNVIFSYCDFGLCLLPLPPEIAH